MINCLSTGLRRLLCVLAVAGTVHVTAPVTAWANGEVQLEDGPADSVPAADGVEEQARPVVAFAPPARLVLGLGQFNVMNIDGNTNPDDNSASVMARVEYRSDWWLYHASAGGWDWGVAPHLGLMANADAGGMVYAGLYGDFAYECGFFFSPALSVGLYRRGDGRDLGGPVVFEEQITAGYEMENKGRIGVSFSHISNGDIYDVNPGVETLMLSYSMPLGGGMARPGHKPAAPAIMDIDAETPDEASGYTPAPEAMDFARLAVTDKPESPAAESAAENTENRQDMTLAAAIPASGAHTQAGAEGPR